MISAESVTCLGGESHMSARVWVTLWVLEDTTYPSGAPTVVSAFFEKGQNNKAETSVEDVGLCRNSKDT